MPIHYIWEDDSKRAIRQVFTGQWTLEEFMASVEEIGALFDEIPHVVDVIVDLTAADHYPANLMQSAGWLNGALRQNTGKIVVVSTDNAIKLIADVTAPLIRRVIPRLHYAHSLAQARALLHPPTPNRNAGNNSVSLSLDV